MDNDELMARNSFIERLANITGASLSSKTVFGDPIEHKGIKIIPVAKVHYGFGGGYGRKNHRTLGKGGGGGGLVQPLGYIEVKDSESSFKPIRPLLSYIPLIVSIGMAGSWLLKRLRS